MTTSWILARLQGYECVLAQKKVLAYMHEKAQQIYPSMFSALQERIRRDVEEYNVAFADHTDCQCSLKVTEGGFAVRRLAELQRELVFVSQPGVIIRYHLLIQYNKRHAAEPEMGHIELKADQDGHICYQIGDELIADVSIVSRKLLERIFC